MAAPTYVAAGTYAATANVSISPGLPAGLATNDVLIAVIDNADNATITLPSGWTLAGAINNGIGSRLTVAWYRVPSGGGAVARTFSKSTGTAISGRIMAFRGVQSTGNPWDVTPTTRANASGTTATATGLTTTTADNLIVMCVGQKFDGNTTNTRLSAWTSTGTGTMTEAIDNTTASGAGSGVGGAYGTMASAGATGDGTATIATAVLSTGVLLALVPATSSPINITGVTASATASAAGGAVALQAVIAPGATAAATAAAAGGTLAARVLAAGATASASAAGGPGAVLIQAAIAGATPAAAASADAGAVLARADVAGATGSGSASAEPGTVTTVAGTVVAGATAAATTSAEGGAVGGRALVAGATPAVAASAAGGTVGGRAGITGATPAVAASAAGGAVLARVLLAGATGSGSASASGGAITGRAAIAGATADGSASAEGGLVTTAAGGPPAVAHLASGSTSTASIATTSPAPGGLFTAGTVQLITAHLASTAAITAPSGEGWVVLWDDISLLNSRRMWAAIRRITSTSPGTTAIAIAGGSVRTTQANMIITGTDPATPVADFTATNWAERDGSPINAPSVSSATMDALLLTVHATYISNTTDVLTSPAGMTQEVFVQAGSTTAPRLLVSTEARPTAGAAGPRGATGASPTTLAAWAASLMLQSIAPTAIPVDIAGATPAVAAAGQPGTVGGRARITGGTPAATASAEPGAVAARALIAGPPAAATASADPGGVPAAIAGATGSVSASAGAGAITARVTITGAPAAVVASADPGTLPIAVVGATAAVSASADAGLIIAATILAGAVAAVAASAQGGAVAGAVAIAGATAAVAAAAPAGSVVVITVTITITGAGVAPSPWRGRVPLPIWETAVRVPTVRSRAAEPTWEGSAHAGH